jgi:PAT family beta-lactamase induction signal transducer AmpG
MLTTKNKLFWVAILYFVEGFPFGLIIDAFPVYFRTHGVSLKEIGLLSLIGLPWTLKFLWAPLVDLFGKRRHWIVACQLLLAVTLLILISLPAGEVGPLLWVLMIALATFSATQDIAIDAYTIELLDPKEMGAANGVRVTTYRVALIAAGGLFVAAAGFIGWQAAFTSAAALLLLSALLSSRAPDPGALPLEKSALPASTNPAKVSPGARNYGAPIKVGPGARNYGAPLVEAVWVPLKQFWERPGFLFVALFVLLFKLGDMAMGPMVKPFWVDRSFTPVQIGLVPGTLGVASTIAGALLGGALTSRWGIFRALWILGIAQAVSNLFYAAAAWLPPSLMMMYTASVVESFTGGLGTAPFLAFLMSICDKRHAATQYALLSALFGLTRSVSGAFSGMATEQLGYVSYFVATFVLAWPAFGLLPWVKKWIPEKRSEEPGVL